jgi:hypothetical protein
MEMMEARRLHDAAARHGCADDTRALQVQGQGSCVCWCAPRDRHRQHTRWSLRPLAAWTMVAGAASGNAARLSVPLSRWVHVVAAALVTVLSQPAHAL